MENLIAGLLTDYERGKMTRRQLIQSLTTAAMAGAAVPAAAAQAAPPASAAPAAPWKTVCLDHISYAVVDYKRSTAFYTGLMGWEVRNDNGKNQCTLDIPNAGTIIIRNSRRPVPAGQATDDGRPPVTGVINHISFGVQPWNTEAVEAELKRRGLNPRPDMVGDDFQELPRARPRRMGSADQQPHAVGSRPASPGSPRSPCDIQDQKLNRAVTCANRE